MPKEIKSNKHSDLFRKYGWNLLNNVPGPNGSILEFWVAPSGLVGIVQIWGPNEVLTYFQDSTGTWDELESLLKTCSQKILTTSKGKPFDVDIFKEHIKDGKITYRVAGMEFDDFQTSGEWTYEDAVADDIVLNGWRLMDLEFRFVGQVAPDGTVTMEVTADASEWIKMAEEPPA